MRRQPRTGVHRGQRAGQAVAIARGALIQKPRQQRQAQAARRRWRRQGEGSNNRQRAGACANGGMSAAMMRSGSVAGGALTKPRAGWASGRVCRRETPPFAVFVPGDVVRAAPLRHGAVAGVAERIAGFLMAVNGRQRQRPAQRLQHVPPPRRAGSTAAGPTRPPCPAQSGGYLRQSPIARRGVVSLPGEARRYTAATPARHDRRRPGVVHSAQIAREPDKMNRVSGIRQA